MPANHHRVLYLHSLKLGNLILNFDVKILVKCEHVEQKYIVIIFSLLSPIGISINLYLPSQHQENNNNYDQQNSTKNSHNDVDKLRI